MRGDETLRMQDDRAEIILGGETLTLHEALALWLWLLAEERDTVSAYEQQMCRCTCAMAAAILSHE